jgi:hypothetical protein
MSNPTESTPAANAAVCRITEADVLRFIANAQQALAANKEVNDGFIEPVRLSVHSHAIHPTHFSISGHFGAEWGSSKHIFVTGDTIAETVAALGREVGASPSDRAAKLREQAAKLLLEADKLSAKAA